MDGTTYYRTVTDVWAQAADATWAPLLGPGHLLLLRGGTGLHAEPMPADSDAPVTAQIADAAYPPMQVAIARPAFDAGATPAADPGERARGVMTLCAHTAEAPDRRCAGCWVRWWVRGAQRCGIALPRRAIVGTI